MERAEQMPAALGSERFLESQHLPGWEDGVLMDSGLGVGGNQ